MEVIFLHSDDWLMIYVDNKFVYEGHSISPEKMAALLNANVKSLNVDQEWAESNSGALPHKFTDIKDLPSILGEDDE
jgi:hypothetical protein